MNINKGSSAKTGSVTLAGMAARFGQVAAVLLLQALVLFLSAGRINWAWAWVFLGVSLLSVAINSVFLLRTSPDTVAERGRPKEMKGWDKLVSGAWSIAQYLLLPLTAGLDSRLGWTGYFGYGWNIAGTVLYAGGLGLFGWAMIANSYFSTVVRIQDERGQTVCREGPYRYLRHPGYLGTILQSIGTAIMLGSLWALIPAVAAMTSMIARTALEDRMLQSELTGYGDYAQQIRYRLLPGVW